jgi:hypothetical protein
MSDTAYMRFYIGRELPLLMETTPEQREKIFSDFSNRINKISLLFLRRLENETKEQTEERKERNVEKIRNRSTERYFFSVREQEGEHLFYTDYLYSYFPLDALDYVSIWKKYVLSNERWASPFSTDDQNVLRLHLLLTRVAYVFDRLGGGGLEQRYRETVLFFFNCFCTEGKFYHLKILLEIYPLRVLYSWGEPIAFAAAQQGHMDIIHLLDESGYDFEREVNSYTMFSVAVINNQIDVLDFLISKGVQKFSTELFFRFTLYVNHDTLNRLIMFFGPDYYTTDKNGFNIITYILLYSKQFLSTKIDNAIYFVALGVDIQQYFSVTPDLYPPEVRYRWQEKNAIVAALKERGYEPTE